MKKIFSVFVLTMVLSGCYKEDIVTPLVEVSPELKIINSVGIKLQTPFVTNEVAMNVKTETAGKVTIKIFDISNKVVSKENVLKVYTAALPSSAYRIGLFDSAGNKLGITDFNKL